MNFIFPRGRNERLSLPGGEIGLSFSVSSSEFRLLVQIYFCLILHNWVANHVECIHRPQVCDESASWLLFQVKNTVSEKIRDLAMAKLHVLGETTRIISIEH